MNVNRYYDIKGRVLSFMYRHILCVISLEHAIETASLQIIITNVFFYCICGLYMQFCSVMYKLNGMQKCIDKKKFAIVVVCNMVMLIAK